MRLACTWRRTGPPARCSDSSGVRAVERARRRCSDAIQADGRAGPRQAAAKGGGLRETAIAGESPQSVALSAREGTPWRVPWAGGDAAPAARRPSHRRRATTKPDASSPAGRPAPTMRRLPSAWRHGPGIARPHRRSMPGSRLPLAPTDRARGPMAPTGRTRPSRARPPRPRPCAPRRSSAPRRACRAAPWLVPRPDRRAGGSVPPQASRHRPDGTAGRPP